MSNQIIKSDHTKISNWLMAKKPAEVDRAISERIRSTGTKFVPMYDYVGHATARLTGIVFEFNGDEKTLDEIQSILDNSNTQASGENIAKWLEGVLLRVPTVSQDQDFVLKKIIEYTKELKKYPADCVKSVLVDETYKFFPSLHELIEKISAMMSVRKAAQYHLDKARKDMETAKRGDAGAKPQGDGISLEDRRARANAILVEFGLDKKITAIKET